MKETFYAVAGLFAATFFAFAFVIGARLLIRAIHAGILVVLIAVVPQVGFSQCNSILGTCNSGLQINGFNHHLGHQAQVVQQVPLLYANQGNLFQQGHAVASQIQVNQLLQAINELNTTQKALSKSLNPMPKYSDKDYQNALAIVNQYKNQQKKTVVQSSHAAETGGARLKAAQVIRDNCASCHGPGSGRPFDISKPMSALMIENIKKRIVACDDTKMPKDGKLSWKDIEAVFEGY